ncbi:hypothetical protein GY45DRAFT_981038 [Cubamyces sp. BRFM 1775]|nr:hypothetical protein GY45DRAFT_981038 [Cubamyces sp. BRFM 1775]
MTDCIALWLAHRDPRPRAQRSAHLHYPVRAPGLCGRVFAFAFAIRAGEGSLLVLLLLVCWWKGRRGGRPAGRRARNEDAHGSSVESLFGTRPGAVSSPIEHRTSTSDTDTDNNGPGPAAVGGEQWERPPFPPSVSLPLLLCALRGSVKGALAIGALFEACIWKFCDRVWMGSMWRWPPSTRSAARTHAMHGRTHG